MKSKKWASPSFAMYSFIHSRISKVPLQEIYSEAPPAQPRRYRSVLSNLQNALSLLLGRIRISKGCPFQVEGPTMENARRCLVAVLARGTNSWPVAEERRARRPGTCRPDTGLQSSQWDLGALPRRHRHNKTAIL